jgi:hypothetical protein
MQLGQRPDPSDAYKPLRIHLLGTWVNKGKKGEPEP